MTQFFDSKTLLNFAEQVLVRAGVRADMAAITAEGLWEASMRGTDSHGLRLLPHYVAGVRGGRINPAPNTSFIDTASSCGILDGDHGFGHFAGVQAMERAIEMAQTAGSGFVAVKNSSHCGAMAFFTLRAAKRGMIGLGFTHATSKVRTPGSTDVFFGTNPICFAAPMEGEEPFCFDAAPTFITSNRLAQYREGGVQTPPGLVADVQGRETCDPQRAEMLLPIGDYKGFGWAMMVDILCGLLTGMPTGKDISKMFVDPMSQKRLIGQFYGAISIDAFTDLKVFSLRLSEMARSIRNLAPRCDPGPLVPGDPEKIARKQRLQQGIPVKQVDLERFHDLACKFGLPALHPMEGVKA